MAVQPGLCQTLWKCRLLVFSIKGSFPFQSEGGLPKPVIYVAPKDDDDEIKTNPDLFSDTNSNRGSLAAVEEGVYPIPDSASEASVDVRQFPAQPKLYQPRYNKHITEVMLYMSGITACFVKNGSYFKSGNDIAELILFPRINNLAV